MTGAVAVIPARLASVRFPRKVLAAETGAPMIKHVADAARRASRVSRVVVATEAAEVADAARAFGVEAVLTAPDHPTGTSRIAQAATILRLPDDAIVVNCQGDEPELDPGVIDAAVDEIVRSGAVMATIASPFGPGEDPRDPNLVKLVRRADGCAIYFSRALIPFNRDGLDLPEARPLKHIGLYVYRRHFLRTYLGLAPTALEDIERLEQLRVVVHGFAIAVAVRESRSVGIDTPEQYAAFVQRFRASQTPGLSPPGRTKPRT